MDRRDCSGLPLVAGTLRFAAAAILTTSFPSAVAIAAPQANLIGVFPGSAAVLSIDGGAPRTVKVGQTLSGVTVVSVDRERAEVQIDGRRQVLALGQHVQQAPSAGSRKTVSLTADARGHFLSDGAINGNSIRFLVDTGATYIAIPAREAVRMGIDYRKGRRGLTQTANGTATTWLVKLDTVRIGSVEVFNVDGVVLEGGLGVALLGMSFLNRFEMKRDGDTMVLTQRF